MSDKKIENSEIVVSELEFQKRKQELAIRRKDTEIVVSQLEFQKSKKKLEIKIKISEIVVPQLEFIKSEQKLEIQDNQKRLNYINTYFDLLKKQKDSKNNMLFSLWMAVTSGIGGIVFPPMFVITLGFIILTTIHTKESLKIRKRLESKYSNLSKLTKEEILKKKESLLQKLNKQTHDYDKFSNWLTEFKCNLQDLYVCRKIAQQSRSEEENNKIIQGYFQSKEVDEYFAEKIEYPNYDGRFNQEKPKQYRKVV